MVMLGRFSSDDPGWREPWDREPDRNCRDDVPVLNPRPKRAGARSPRRRSTPSRHPITPSEREDSGSPNRDSDL